MKDAEIWLKVMERFPKIKSEKTCRTEREMRQKARDSYYEQLKKKKLLERGNEDAAKVAGEV